MSLKTNPTLRQKKKKNEFDPEKELGTKCSDCPYQKNPKARPPKINPKAKLVIVQDWPTKQEIHKGEAKRNSTQAFVENCVRSSGTINFSHSWALLCRPETAKDKGIAQAIKCCSPRLQQHFTDSSEVSRWALAAGPEAFHALTLQEGSSAPWLGTPVEGRWSGLQVIPTHIPWLVRMKAGARFAGQFLAHIDRACRLSDGRLTEFKWPVVHTEPGLEMDLAIERIVNYSLNRKVGVDIETRSDMSISCLGIAIPDVAVCLQFPLSARHHECIDSIFSLCVPVTQNGPSFDHRVLKAHGFEIPAEKFKYEDTMLIASILNPQLPKNLGSLVSNEFHASAHKAQFKTDEETGRMMGDWDSRDPEVEKARRLYCGKDAWTTLMLEEVQQEQLRNYK